MSALLFIILFVGLVVLLGWFFSRILYDKGELPLLYFVVLFLPFYIVFLSLVYHFTGSPMAVMIVQGSKELVITSFIAAFFLFQNKPQFKGYRIVTTDVLFSMFSILALTFAFLPIGEASLVNKLLYLKSIFLMAAMYFIGRNSTLGHQQIKQLFSAILVLIVLAGAVVFIERATNTHLHSLIGFGDFNFEINNIESTGNYGLTWTFEAEYGNKRFGSFFPNPLEFAASLLLAGSVALILLIKSPYTPNKLVYLGVFVTVLFCLFMAYSRASFAAFLIMLFFIAYLFRSYKLILIGVGFVFSLILGYFYLLDKETQYYIIDTLTFQTTSSVGHVLDWIEAAESIIANPQGIGLATSGNIGSVEADIQVGGENQFLIYGVQMGVFGMLIYIFLLSSSIRRTSRIFRRLRNVDDKLVPFVAAATKFGLILPLFTSNADSYAFVTLLSWWMVGYAIHLEKEPNEPEFSPTTS